VKNSFTYFPHSRILERGNTRIHIIEIERKGNITMIYDNSECGSPEFLTALGVFDALLDDLIHASRNGNGVAVSRSPASGHCSVSTVRPTNACSCGGDCSKSDRIGRLDILDDIDQVIYNDPATIVTFKDGSKVCVKASKGDTFSKETGLIYAIVKRLYANDIEESTGYLRSKGLGEKINKIVAGSFDQKEQEKQRRAKRKAKQAKKEAAAAKAKEAVDKD
jgi:hypothetical protein